MTIDEAIKELFDHTDTQYIKEPEYFTVSLMLGIEALKRCKVLAENNPLWAAKPLPGETDKE